MGKKFKDLTVGDIFYFGKYCCNNYYINQGIVSEPLNIHKHGVITVSYTFEGKTHYINVPKDFTTSEYFVRLQGTFNGYVCGTNENDVKEALSKMSKYVSKARLFHKK